MTAEVGNVYVPGPKVRPPRSDAASAIVGVDARALVYALRHADSALQAAVPPADVTPVHLPGGKPVMPVPGQVPQSPVITVAPVLVSVVAEMAPYVLARPITMGGPRFTTEGWATMRPLNCVMMRATRETFEVLGMVNFMVTEVFE